MDLYKRQQFGFFLQIAVERLVEPNRGAGPTW